MKRAFYIITMLLSLTAVAVVVSEECKTQVKLMTCDNTKSNPMIEYFYYLHHASVKTCSNKTAKIFRWGSTSTVTHKTSYYQHFYHKHSMPIPISQFNEGTYTLFVEVKEKGGILARDACLLDVSEEPLVLVFGPDHVSSAKALQPFKLQIDIRKARTTKVGLTWDITCKPVKDCACDYYKDTAQPQKGKKLAVAEFVAHECTSEITFNVGAYRITNKNKIYKFKHVVKVSEDVTMNVAVKMTKGGLHKADVNPGDTHSITFGLTCLANCLGFKKMDTHWTVTSNGVAIDMELNRKNNKMMMLTGKALGRGKTLVVTATGKSSGESFVASMTFTTLPELKPSKCDINPKEGISLNTTFVIKCVHVDPHYKSFPPRYEVSETISSKETVIMNTALDTFEVLIRGSNSKGQLSIKTFDKFHNYMPISVPTVKITKQKLTRTAANDIIKRINYNNNVGDYNTAVMLTYHLLDEVRDANMPANEKKAIVADILSTVKKLKVITSFQYTALTRTIAPLMEHAGDDAKLRTDLRSFCNDVSKIKMDTILFSRYKSHEGADIRKYSDDITQCVSLTISQATTTTATKASIEISTPKMPDNYIIVTENIPDYDFNFPGSEFERDKLSGDVHDRVLDLANSYLATLDPEENITIPRNEKQIDSLGFGLSLAKDTGKDLAGQTHKVNRASVKVPPYFAEKYKDDVIGLRIASFNPNFLGQLPREIVTTIVDAAFQKFDGTEAHDINGPFEIEFDAIRDEDTFELFYMPHLTNIVTTDVSLDFKINVHRLNLKKGQRCSVKFVLGPEVKLKILFTVNRRPLIRDFGKNTLIVDNNYMNKYKFIQCPFQANFDIDRFAYLGVIATSGATEKPQVLDSSKLANSKQNSDGPKIAYNASFYYHRCMVYNNNTFRWDISGCMVEMKYENAILPKITCRCSHSSLHAAEHYKIDSKWDRIHSGYYEVQPFKNYNVLIVVAVIFSLYCIILCFYHLREMHLMSKDKIIFLSDNLKNDRYAYMIVVKTLNTIYSGTTSNVCVQIFGENLCSFPHLLNFPDPDKMILQRNKMDWFILCTSLYLGEIKYIDIWLDNIGHRPSWFCEDIVVIDLQSKDRFYFYVNADISVTSQKNVYLRRYPTARKFKLGLIEIFSRRFNFHLGAENTWNLVSRGNDKIFLFHQRVTVVLSMVYTTYAFIIILFGSPRLRMFDVFGKGDFHIHMYTVIDAILASIVCYTINYPSIFIFRHSAKTRQTYSLIIEATVFPAEFISIAWSLVITTIITCMLYLIIFGFSVPIFSGYVWMFTGWLSIIFSILITENVAVTISEILLDKFRLFRRVEYNYKYLIRAVEKQRRILFRTFGEFLMRPYFKKHYRKLTLAEICQIKEREIERNNDSYLFRELVFYLTYLVLSYIVMITSGDKMLVISNKHMHKMVEGVYNLSHVKLADVDELHKIYDYIQFTIVPMTHGYGWYGKLYVPDPGILEDFNTKIIGVVQIRQQLRIQKCQRPAELRDYQIPCTNKTPDVIQKSTYYDNSQVTSFRGILEVYGGDGYIVHLGRSYYNALYVINLLRNTKWLSANTKVVFIEFWTFNTNSNYFNSVRIAVEISPTGNIVQSVSVYTVRLLVHNPVLELIEHAIWIYYYMFVLFLVLMQVSINLKRYGRRYYQNFWNYVDTALVTSHFTMVVLYTMIFYKLDALFEELTNSESTDFVNYFDLMRLARLGDNILAFIIFIATSKLWKFLRFGVVFQVLELSLKTTVMQFIGAFMYQGIIFFTIAIYYHLMFGHMLDNFRSIVRSITGIYLNSTNSGKKFNKTYYFRYIQVAFLIWSIFMICAKVFYSFYCTILMLGFNLCKIEFSNRRKTSSIQSYIRDEVEYNWELWKRKNAHATARLAGGQSSESMTFNAPYKFVRPKADSQRYADCVAMPDSKMNLMRLIAICIIKHMERQHNPDVKIEITNDTYILLGKVFVAFGQSRRKPPKGIAHQTLFLQTKDVDNTMKYVPNSRLLHMEYYLERMFQRKALDRTDVSQKIHVQGDEERLGHFQKLLQNIADVASNIKLVYERLYT